MLTVEEHLENLVRHIELVREAGLLLGKRLIRQGEEEFGRLLIACQQRFRVGPRWRGGPGQSASGRSRRKGDGVMVGGVLIVKG
jgi:hypothetical protein